MGETCRTVIYIHFENYSINVIFFTHCRCRAHLWTLPSHCIGLHILMVSEDTTEDDRGGAVDT